VKGIGSRELELDYIDDDNEIKEGDDLITSGLDRIYPKGIPLGTVTSVGPRRGLIKYVTIRPHADLGRLEEVLCVVEHPPEIPDPSQMPEATSSSTSN
jgi:rod shape-determining protein MreC